MTIEPGSMRELRSSSKSPTRHSIRNNIQRALEHASDETCLEFPNVDAQLAKDASQCLEEALENRNCRHVNGYVYCTKVRTDMKF
jgi:1,6-anhydro-N-acetylmuramate kinase